MGSRRFLALATTALAGLAGAPALAQQGAVQPAPTLASAPARGGALAISRPPSPFDADQALRDRGLARTSLDRRLEVRDATASLGFLCGRQPYADTHGGAGAYGDDPTGRFLGAQLKFGFR